jgi:hypothetical protein
MSNPIISRAKSTLQTRFHIDYDWWGRDEHNLRLYLISHLPPDLQGRFGSEDANEVIDWVDPDTAEVRRVDGLQMALQQAAKSGDFITANTSLVDAVFRVFLSNNNTPLTPVEIGEIIDRPPEMILRTIAGRQVYKGIRPVTES